MRAGCGKVKHLEVRQLWLQSHIRSGALTYGKIPRETNSSDSLAHFSAASFSTSASMDTSSDRAALNSQLLIGAPPPASSKGGVQKTQSILPLLSGSRGGGGGVVYSI